MDRQAARRADGYGLWPLAHEVRRPERRHFGVRGRSIGWIRLQTTNAGAISRAVPDPFRALKPRGTPMAACWQARPHALCRNWVGCVSSAQGTAIVDRVETMQARYRRRQSQQHLTLLSLGPALAAESKVGVTARTVSSQGSRDRPQPLQSTPSATDVASNQPSRVPSPP